MTTPAPQPATDLQGQLTDGSLAGSWTLDPARSTVTFQSRSMWGLVPVRGVFREVAGSGAVSPTGDVAGHIEIAAASLDTKNAKRDTHLRSADFFLSEKHPTITFALDRLAVAGDGLTAAGTLTVRETSRPVSFPVTAAVSDGDVVLDGTVQVDRSEFGLTWSPAHLASFKNAVVIHAVFTKA